MGFRSRNRWRQLVSEVNGRKAIAKANPLKDRLALVEGRSSSNLTQILRIFSLKKFMKSLLLRSIGLHGSTDCDTLSSCSVLILIWFIEGTVMSRFRQNIRRDGTLPLEMGQRERYCVCSSRLVTRLTVFNIHTCYQYLHIPRGGVRPTDSPHPGLGVNSHDRPEPRRGQRVGYVPVMRSVYERLNLNLGHSVFLGSTCMLRESSPCDYNRW